MTDTSPQARIEAAPCGCRVAVSELARGGPVHLDVPCQPHGATWLARIAADDTVWWRVPPERNDPDQLTMGLDVDASTVVPANDSGSNLTKPCRSCGARVFWRKHTGTGKSAPIDATPAPDGNLVLIAPDGYAVLGQDPTLPPGTLRFTNHFSTCPNAAEHRGGS